MGQKAEEMLPLSIKTTRVIIMWIVLQKQKINISPGTDARAGAPLGGSSSLNLSPRCVSCVAAGTDVEATGWGAESLSRARLVACSSAICELIKE